MQPRMEVKLFAPVPQAAALCRRNPTACHLALVERTARPPLCVGVEEQRAHTYANRCSGIGPRVLGPVVTEHRACLCED